MLVSADKLAERAFLICRTIRSTRRCRYRVAFAAAWLHIAEVVAAEAAARDECLGLTGTAGWWRARSIRKS
jgi:hypothetical protein